jgi:hypothetical protein
LYWHFFTPFFRLLYDRMTPSDGPVAHKIGMLTINFIMGTNPIHSISTPISKKDHCVTPRRRSAVIGGIEKLPVDSGSAGERNIAKKSVPALGDIWEAMASQEPTASTCTSRMSMTMTTLYRHTPQLHQADRTIQCALNVVSSKEPNAQLDAHRRELLRDDMRLLYADIRRELSENDDVFEDSDLEDEDEDAPDKNLYSCSYDQLRADFLQRNGSSNQNQNV